LGSALLGSVLLGSALLGSALLGSALLGSAVGALAGIVSLLRPTALSASNFSPLSAFSFVARAETAAALGFDLVSLLLSWEFIVGFTTGAFLAADFSLAIAFGAAGGFVVVLRAVLAGAGVLFLLGAGVLLLAAFLVSAELALLERVLVLEPGLGFAGVLPFANAMKTLPVNKHIAILFFWPD